MQYNTNRARIAMPEYGRTVQQMVEHCISIPNAERRMRCARNIIAVMASMHPGMKNQEDFRHKLWDHLAYISDYKLQVDYPYPVSRMDEKNKDRKRVAYPRNHIHNRHYGHLNEAFLNHLATMPKSKQRDELAMVVANQMKQSLYDWNREAVDDSKVASDMASYTGGLVKLDLEHFTFDKVVKTPKTMGKKKKK
ncbi:MAG: DUF4290 domain-containing protein [Bacteroidales bacterium]|nr:DUF4290 domain-containing protein [Candidatus Physcousia equi]